MLVPVRRAEPLAARFARAKRVARYLRQWHLQARLRKRAAAAGARHAARHGTGHAARPAEERREEEEVSPPTATAHVRLQGLGASPRVVEETPRVAAEKVARAAPEPRPQSQQGPDYATHFGPQADRSS